MGVTVRVISKDSEEKDEKTTQKEITPVVKEKAAENVIPSEEKEDNAPFHYDKSYRAKTAYTRFGLGAVIAVGAILSMVILLSIWGVRSFGSDEAVQIADRIICEIV